MKEGKSDSRLRFLENNTFSRDFCFNNEPSFRKPFKRLVHMHVISNKIGNAEGYEIVGKWPFNESENILKNDFDKEKQSIISELKAELKKTILKCNELSRYAILGFYVKIVENETTFEELLNRILNEMDEIICPESIKKFARSLTDMTKIKDTLKFYLPMEKDLSTVKDIKNMIETFLKDEYFRWLQSFNKYDLIPKIPDEISFSNLLLLDPSILKMIASVRGKISDHWNINITFDIKRPIYNLEDSIFIDKFQAAWRNYLRDTEAIKKLMKVEKKYYKHGWSEFEVLCKEIRKTCDQYVVCMENLTKILVCKNNSKILNQKSLISIFNSFHTLYSSLFDNEFYLDSSGLTNYEVASNKLFDKIINEFMHSFKHVTKDIIDFERLKNNYSIDFLLNMTQYLYKIDQVLDYNIDENNKEFLKYLIKLQNKFLINLENNSIQMDRALQIFSLIINNYRNTIQKWNAFEKLTHIKESFEKINANIKLCFEFSLDISDELLDKETSIAIFDFFDEINNFILNIKYLPCYCHEAKATSRELTENELLNSSKTIKHLSYEVIAEALGTLTNLIQKYKGIDIKIIPRLCEKYFDVLGEMSKQFNNQLNVDPETFKKKKLKLFNRCLEIGNLNNLMDYLNALKKYTILTTDKNEAFSSNTKIPEFYCFSELSQQSQNIYSYDRFDEHFNQNLESLKELRRKPDDNIESLRNEIRKIATEIPKESPKKSIREIIVKLFFILSTKNELGVFEELDELKTKYNYIQIVGCMRILELHKEAPEFKTVKEWLLNISKQVIEITENQAKSLQIKLLSIIFALVDFEVIIVNNRADLDSDECQQLARDFTVFDNELKNIRFTTLEKLVQEELEEDYNVNELPTQLVEQVIFKGEYDEEFGISERKKKKNRIYIFKEIETLVESTLKDSVLIQKIFTSEILAKEIEIIYKKAKQTANLNKSKRVVDIYDKIVIKNNAFEAFQKILKRDGDFTTEIHKDLFFQYFNELWTSAIKVANFYSDNSKSREIGKTDLKDYLYDGEPLFKLSHDSQFCEYYSNNKWSHKVYPEYLNCFFYLELFSRQNKCTEKNPSAYGYIKLNCGKIHYSSIILERSNDLIIGIGNSIKKRQSNELLLSSVEQDILGLDSFGIQKQNITCFPAFFNLDRIKEDIFNIEKNKDEWEEKICKLSRSLSEKDEVCLIWFKNEIDLKKFFHKLQDKQPFILTNNQISINQFGERKLSLNEFFELNERERYAWIKSLRRLTSEHFSGQSGKITLAMFDYVRYIDFECNGDLNKHKGFNIIQTFFSEDLKEEIQIKERSVRNGAPVKYYQIINLDDLKSLNYDGKLSVSTKYDELRKRAETSLDTKYLNMKQNLKYQEEKKSELYKWLSYARIDRAKKIKTNKKSDIDQLLQVNYSKIV